MFQKLFKSATQIPPKNTSIQSPQDLIQKKAKRIKSLEEEEEERGVERAQVAISIQNNTMKGREGKGPPSTDLLVCFPSRAHLTLMPKPICSPARPSEPNKRHHHHHHHHHKKLTARSGGQASPLLWAKSKTSEIAEPTSPKVTCAGQIKVRPGRPAKPGSCKNWQSVMEEIERLHKRKPAWIETTFGFKKDVMQFLTCLRNIRFDFRCFGSFPSADVTSDDEDEEEVEDEEEDFRDKGKANDESESSRTMFSKWFMVLQESQNPEPNSTEEVRDDFEESCNPPCGPPPNALLLMRCRSAPAKSWLEERQEKQEEEEEEEKSKMVAEEEESNNEKNKKKNKESLVVMRYGKDFYKFSSDIAKETWVVGGITDPLSRSRSWKR